MRTTGLPEQIGNAEFIDKIYQFSYRRCNTSFEAEDLCSDIIFAVISAMRKQSEIKNFYAFVWTIAHRVYADFCEKRSKASVNLSIENAELSLVEEENDIDTLVEKAEEAEQIKKIFSEIAFLSNAYRDVMVMYYIDEYKIKDIALLLGISETTVKQRLFSARNSIRREVKIMNDRNLSLKPIRLAISGTGNPCGNDPRSKSERTFSQNLIYLCKDKPRTAKELSEELCVPMPYIVEQLDIQCRGENGSYGMLRKLENGKYVANILLVDYEEYDEANKIYERHLPEFCRRLKNALEQNKEKILSFPYLSSQKDSCFILWTLISRTIWDFEQKINSVIANKYFSDIVPVERVFSCVAVAFRDETAPILDFYGCDGIDASDVGGYRSVFVSNIYGKRVDKHLHCGHNLSQDLKLLMVLKAIGGLPVDELTENEKEIAAKAIECGYLCKKGNVLEPKIIVIDRKNDQEFYNLSFDLNTNMKQIIEDIADELSVFMKKRIPEHLISEYQIYTQLIAGVRILSQTIEECIKEGILSEPENRIGAEGVLMIVEK